MKRIAVWGTGRRCAMWYRYLREHYDIACFVNNEAGREGQIDGTDLISKNELGRYEYDAVVIVTNNFVEAIKEDAWEAGIAQDKVFTLDDFIESEKREGEYEKETAVRQKEVLNAILDAADEQIHDHGWMYQRVIEYGVFCFRKDWLEMNRSINWSFDGVQQVPGEFAEYCVMVSRLKIQSAIEIGVYRGRSAYFVCAVLSRINPNLKYIMVDVEDRLDSFEDFKEVLPALEKRIPSTSSAFTGRQFDYVFIDADHSYDASIADYENVGAFSNVITAFHDIYAHEYDHENGGTVRMWKEVLERTKDKEHKVFSRYPDKWMGIGCVLNGKQ